jgi:hypothetical protein
LFIKDTNQLVIGDGSSDSISSSKPITVEEIINYGDDTTLSNKLAIKKVD